MKPLAGKVALVAGGTRAAGRGGCDGGTAGGPGGSGTSTSHTMGTDGGMVACLNDPLVDELNASHVQPTRGLVSDD